MSIAETTKNASVKQASKRSTNGYDQHVRLTPPKILDQAAPRNIEAEQKLLGCVLLDPEQFDTVSLVVRSIDFYDARSGMIFAHLQALKGDGAVDATLLIDRMQRHGDLGESDESVDTLRICLTDAINSVGAPSLARHYANIIREHAEKRSIIHTATDALQSAYDGTTVASELSSRLAAALDKTANAMPAKIEGMSCKELMSTIFETNYLIEDFLVDRQPCILAGPKKCLKTSVLIDIGIALAVGGHVLGRFNVPRAVRVGLMSGESGMSTIQETVKRIACKAAHDPAGITNLIVTDQIPRFSDPESLEAVRRFLIDNELAVLMIDPCYMAMSGADAGNLFIQGEQLRGISGVCQDAGVTLILAHHTKKTVANPYGQPELEDIAWSGFAEFARQWILLGRRRPYEPGSGHHELWLSTGGSAGHGGGWALDIDEGSMHDDGGRHWTVDVQLVSKVRRKAADAINSEKAQQRLEDARKQIVNALTAHPDGETSTGIRDASGLHNRAFKPAIDSLVKDGTISTCEVTKSNRKCPYPGYRLTTHE